MTKSFNKAMGAVLRHLRIMRGLPQGAVGKALGVSYQQISKVEAGTNGCSAYQLSQFAEFFDISVSELYGRAALLRAQEVAA